MCLTAGFEQIGESNEIALDIGMRIFQAVAHASLSREMDHPVKRPAREAFLQRAAIRQIGTMKNIVGTGSGRDLFQFPEPGLDDDSGLSRIR